MQLVHTAVTITFAVHIFLHKGESEPGPNHSTHMPKLALQNSLACHHPVYMLYLHLLPIHIIGKLFVMSLLMSSGHPWGYYLKKTLNIRLTCLNQM